MSVLSEWFTKNPVAANLLALLVILGGKFTLSGIRIEGFPKIPPTSISIYVSYPDASAEQVDIGIARKVEKALEGLAGIKKNVDRIRRGGPGPGPEGNRIRHAPSAQRCQNQGGRGNHLRLLYHHCRLLSPHAHKE